MHTKSTHHGVHIILWLLKLLYLYKIVYKQYVYIYIAYFYFYYTAINIFFWKQLK